MCCAVVGLMCTGSEYVTPQAGAFFASFITYILAACAYQAHHSTAHTPSPIPIAKDYSSAEPLHRPHASNTTPLLQGHVVVRPARCELLLRLLCLAARSEVVYVLPATVTAAIAALLLSPLCCCCCSAVAVAAAAPGAEQGCGCAAAGVPGSQHDCWGQLPQARHWHVAAHGVSLQ